MVFQLPITVKQTILKLSGLKHKTISLLLILWARTLGRAWKYYLRTVPYGVGQAGWIKASLTHLGPRGWPLALCSSG